MVTNIATNTRFIGNVEGDGDMVIEGTVIGDICLTGKKSKIVIEKHGLVEGSVIAANVEIHGRVSGDVKSAGTIHAGSQSIVDGSLLYHSITMETGATIRGLLKTMPAA